MKKIFPILMLAVLFCACKVKDKQSEINNGDLKATGYLKNLTGLDACGWVIALDKNAETKLEPLNLSKFKLKLVDGKEVVFTYKLSNTTTACMVGQVIELRSIKYK